jgi:hypothetical protein
MWRRGRAWEAYAKGVDGAKWRAVARAARWLSSLLGILIFAPVPAGADLKVGPLAPPGFADRANACMAEIETTTIGKTILTWLRSSDSRWVHLIYPQGNPKGVSRVKILKPDESVNGTGSSTIVRWNWRNFPPRYCDGKIRDPCSALLHELAHVYTADRGIRDRTPILNDPTVRVDEIQATQAQNSFLLQKGLVFQLRERYCGTYVSAMIPLPGVIAPSRPRPAPPGQTEPTPEPGDERNGQRQPTKGEGGPLEADLGICFDLAATGCQCLCIVEGTRLCPDSESKQQLTLPSIGEFSAAGCFAQQGNSCGSEIGRAGVFGGCRWFPD